MAEELSFCTVLCCDISTTVEEHRRKGKINLFCNVVSPGKAPVAQLDRASDYGSEGLRFESPRARFSGLVKCYGKTGREKCSWTFLNTRIFLATV